MSPRVRNALIVVVVAGLSFGGGSAWQFAKARQARQERDAATAEVTDVRRQLAMEQLEATLAVATVAAQLGNFERSRQLASDFFTRLQDQAASAPAEAGTAIAGILASRDALITALSRSQPEAGLDLARTLAAFQHALGKEATVPVPMPPDTTGGGPG
jgi:hypothetical protein